jgi:hypothetical protein
VQVVAFCWCYIQRCYGCAVAKHGLVSRSIDTFNVLLK